MLITLLKASIDALLQIKQAWEEGIKECRTLQQLNIKLSTRIEKVEGDNKQLQDRVRHLEDKLLEGNVIMQGIPDTLWEPWESTKEKVLSAISHTISGNAHEDKMEQAHRIPIKDVQRKGKFTTLRTRPVLVEFYHKSDTEFLLCNRSHLPKGVYIDKQYSKDTERIRRKLRPILTAARKSENYKGKCHMDGSTLIIKGRNYTLNNLHSLPSEINGFRATSKTDHEKNVIGFFGELNPLSNFHPAPFKINGQTYHSSEQYIQYQKCLVFGDHETADSILKADTAIDCKNIGRDVKNFEPERWKQNAKARCTPGILAKFKQNPLLSELLKSTGMKTIVESC